MSNEFIVPLEYLDVEVPFFFPSLRIEEVLYSFS